MPRHPKRITEDMTCARDWPLKDPVTKIWVSRSRNRPGTFLEHATRIKTLRTNTENNTIGCVSINSPLNPRCDNVL